MINSENSKQLFNERIPSDWGCYLMQEITEVTRLAGYEYSEYWIETDSGEITALKGENIGKNEIIGKNLSYISNELSLKLKRSRLYKNDIVFPCVGTIGNSYVVTENDKYHINQNIAKISPNQNKVDSLFLAQFLMSYLCKNEIRKFNATTSQPNVLVGSLRNFRINLPPLPEQRAIANVLALMDNAISQNNQLVAQKYLRKKWLMQNLLTGKKRLKGFGGEWRKLGAGEIFKSVSLKGFEDEELLSATQDRGIIPRSKLEGRVTMPDGTTAGYKLVERGDFVISLRSFQGGLEYSYYRGIVSPAYIVLKPTVKIDDEFYKQYYKSHEFIGRLAIAVIGIRDGKQVSYDDYCTVKIPYPSLDEQTAIAQVLQAADKEIQLLKTKTEKLREQKKGMMQQLLTGKKRLKIEAQG